MEKYRLNYLEKKQMKMILRKMIIYFFLIIFGFSFVLPIIQAFFLSFFSRTDITDPYIQFIPLNPTLDNYRQLLTGFDLSNKVIFSIVYAAGSALLQTISTAVVGYGLARFNFKGKNLILILIVVFFLVPQTVVMIQNYVLMGNLQLNDTLFVFYIPALLGQGLNSSIFILIFYSFFGRISKELYESAQLEGARAFDVFAKIILPLVKGAIIITFVLSFVWYWNDGTIAPQYYRNIPTVNESLELQLDTVESANDNLEQEFPIYDGIKAAAITTMVMPLLIFYLLIQKKFTESTVGTGLTGQ